MSGNSGVGADGRAWTATTDIPDPASGSGGSAFGNEVITPVNAASATLKDTTGTVTLTPSTTVAGFTLNLPLAPLDGQIVTIACRGNQITALTIAVQGGSGQTIYGTATGVMDSGGYMSFKYTITGKAWDRVA